MKYLLIICLLAAACSSARKIADQQKQEVKKSSTVIRDSTGQKAVDSIGVQSLSGSTHITIDSGYDKVTEEEVKEVIDSGIIRRETKRTIKEKGQKKVEKSIEIIQKDSSSKHIKEQAAVKQVRKQDSSSFTMVKDKQVDRIMLLPWWVWIIAVLVLMGILWWKKKSIIDLFI